MERFMIAVIGLGQMGLLYVQKLLASGINPEGIIGIDIDPGKVAAAKEKFPRITVLDSMEKPAMVNFTGSIGGEMECFPLRHAYAAIVATNTPSHHKVIVELMERGVKRILCEKPLGLDMAAVDEIRDAMVRHGARVYTAFLMNFSPALLHLIGKMQAENLVLTEGTVVWGKNRYGDRRPTPGDLEDETVHGVGILHNLCAVNQRIYQIDVAAKLTYPKYASPEAQAKAHALDPSFPMEVNASTMAMERILTDKGEVACNMHSSFILGSQVRRVTAVLSQADDPNQPVYSVEFNFDVKTADKIVDKLTVTTLDGNKVEQLEFVADKLRDQTLAFVTAAESGAIDPRLTDYNKAREAVAFTEAVFESHRSGQWVTAYTEADVIEFRQSSGQ